MEELIFKYEPLRSYAELDGLKWDNTKRGTVYTFSGMSDHVPGVTPSPNGAVVVLRYGGLSTLQILIGGDEGVFVRRLLNNTGNWYRWEKL